MLVFQPSPFKDSDLSEKDQGLCLPTFYWLGVAILYKIPLQFVGTKKAEPPTTGNSAAFKKTLMYREGTKLPLISGFHWANHQTTEIPHVNDNSNNRSAP